MGCWNLQKLLPTCFSFQFHQILFHIVWNSFGCVYFYNYYIFLMNWLFNHYEMSLFSFWWECKLVHPLWRTLRRFLKKLKIVTIWSSNPTSRHISGENSDSKRYMHPSVHSNTVYNSQDMEAIYMSIDRRMNKEDVVCVYICTTSSLSIHLLMDI